MNRQPAVWKSSLSLLHEPSASKPHSSSSIRKQHGERVRKWPICSKADSTNTRVRPKGRGLLPVVPTQPVKTSEDDFSLLKALVSLTHSFIEISERKSPADLQDETVCFTVSSLLTNPIKRLPMTAIWRKNILKRLKITDHFTTTGLDTAAATVF